jgi:hypothetical protein
MKTAAAVETLEELRDIFSARLQSLVASGERRRATHAQQEHGHAHGDGAAARERW